MWDVTKPSSSESRRFWLSVPRSCHLLCLRQSLPSLCRGVWVVERNRLSLVIFRVLRGLQVLCLFLDKRRLHHPTT